MARTWTKTCVALLVVIVTVLFTVEFTSSNRLVQFISVWL